MRLAVREVQLDILHRNVRTGSNRNKHLALRRSSSSCMWGTLSAIPKALPLSLSSLEISSDAEVDKVNRRKLLEEGLVPLVQACCLTVGINQSSQTAFLLSLPTIIRWQASREGVCWVGWCNNLLRWGNMNTRRLEVRHAQEYCWTNFWKSPAGMQQSK